MPLRLSSVRHRWAFTLIVTNIALGVVLLVLVSAGDVRTLRDFLRVFAFTVPFANLTSILAMLFVNTVAERLARRRHSVVPFAILSIFVIVPVGCLLAQGLQAVFNVWVRQHFWSQYLHTIKVSVPLALVFGLGALAYASLQTRLEAAELRLSNKELAEERTRKLAAETRLRSLESWIHPHFLFNTLNSISALIATNPALAEQIVSRLATLLRASLDSSGHSLIPLRQELAMVESYADIERVRFGDKLRGTIDVPAELQEIKVPPMSVQSLVENAVKHGITPQPNGGEFLVSVRPADNSIRIEIRDSGPGFDLTSMRAGHGLDKLVQRLDALFGDRARLNAFRRDGYSVVEMVLPRT